MGARIITTVLTKAASYDLIDLATVRDELSASDPKDDGFLARAISQASRAVAQYCNRTFVVEVVQDAIYLQMDHYPWQVPGGAQPLQLSRWPLVTTASFTGSLAAAGATTITGLSSTTGLSVGLPIADANPGSAPPATILKPTLAPGTTITAIGSGQVTISQPAVGGGTGLAFIAGVTASVADPNGNGLVAGQDYMVDADRGELLRLWAQTGYPMRWEAAPTTVIYQAGYSTIPDDVIDATLRLITLRYRGRGRDPMLRSIDQPGLGVETYWVGGPPKSGSLPEEIAGMLDSYRVPVVA